MNNEELYRSMDGIDDEILQKYYKYKPANKIVNFRKAAVIAASICLLVVAGSVIKIMSDNSYDTAMEQADPETAAEIYSDESNSEEKGDDMFMAVEGAAPAPGFTITACASENDKTLLESGKTIPLKLGNAYTTYGFSKTENDEIAFQFYLPQLIVEGENIANITYSVDKNEMTVSNYSYDRNGQIDKNSGTTEFGSQYTVAYEDQQNKFFRVILNGHVASNDKLYHGIFEPDTYQEKLDAINKILDGAKITCEVTYEDGTTETADIVLGAEYHTYDELEDVFGEDYKTDIYKDGAIVITFELQ